MESKWLEDFLSLARTRNFSRSSEERHVTQPAFSRRIKALENWLGTELFDRRTFPIGLTPDGRMFCDTAESILNQLNRERAHFRKQYHSDTPTLRIAAATTLNLNFIPGWLHGLQGQTGPLLTYILTKNFHDMVSDLGEGHVDLVLQYCTPEVPVLFDTARYEALTLSRENMVLASPVNADGTPLHDPARGRPIPYVGYSRDSYFQEIEKLAFNANPETSKLLQRCNESPTSEFLKRMAITFGTAVMLPESCMRDRIDSAPLLAIGGESWCFPLDIQIYRARSCDRPVVNRFWETLSGTC